MSSLIIVLFLLNLGFSLVKSELNDTCTTTSNQIGRCIPVRDCQPAIKILRSPFEDLTNEEWYYIENNSCGKMPGSSLKLLICCPLIQNVEGCGVAKIGRRIYGGNETETGLYPWAGVIVYKVSRRKFSVHCGCTLVHHRWVLTAAHCIRSIPRSWSINRVRFNEWDTTKKSNCTSKNDVSICREEYEITQQFAHPSYQVNNANMRHDIGLLKTKTDVVINDFVIPICLPLSDMIKQLPIDQEDFIVTGWGQTDKETPGIQRDVIMTGQKNNVCDKAYESHRIKLTEDQLCIGGREGEDSCRGDSGGPLMREHGLVNYQIGIVSFGAYKCGTKGHPGVYTKLIDYLDWIEEIMTQN
ncbi:CLIP domain-containing serine protease B15-like [Ochlerotatus camptorhynchus]|uniref:CLIP domain-containing serine protease B15-like n=1 Tax=Ochlerotatus camptorhynchus TaxID=644619 RepID=UPI0031D302F6